MSSEIDIPPDPSGLPRQSVRRGGARRLVALAAPVLTCILFGGCHLLSGGDGGRAIRQAQPALDPDVAATEAGMVPSVTGCGLSYRLYRPAGPITEGSVILAHGFLRTKERMDGLARALADAGIVTATMDFCNDRIWDGGHEQNGRDMVTLARALRAEPVVYAGFSAGGLAALIAASRDPGAHGVIALDLVDDKGLGVRAAGALNRPLIGLMGEPSACNADGNGLTVFAAGRRSRVERVPGAGHCDFEAPTNWLCELVCGRTPESEDLRREIIESVVSSAVDLLGANGRDS